MLYSQVKDKKPKKPMNAFFVYRKAHRDKIKTKFGTKKSNEISKIAGMCWAKESAQVKDQYRAISFNLQQQSKQDLGYFNTPISTQQTKQD